MDRVIHKEDGIEYTHNPYTGKCLTCGSLTAYSGFCFECDKENRMIDWGFIDDTEETREQFEIEQGTPE